MDDPLLPYLTLMLEHPDMNEWDIQQECDRMFQRNRAIAALKDGELPPDVLLDMLAEHTIEPYEWLDCVEDNLNFLGLPCG